MEFLEYNDTNISLAEGNFSVDDAYYSLIKQPVYMVVVLGLAYGIIFVLALLGNICVMVIIYKDKRFHTATYVFLVNLAISDLLVAFCCLPITLMSNLYSGKILHLLVVYNFKKNALTANARRGYWSHFLIKDKTGIIELYREELVLLFSVYLVVCLFVCLFVLSLSSSAG